jgi:ribosome biogenesis SPOUT family RNA methylase Rps3
LELGFFGLITIASRSLSQTIFLCKHEVPMAPSWLDERFRLTALRLHKQGLVKNGSPDSWHVYALRHSFETEAGHARVPSEIRDSLLDDLRGIQWVYNHRDQLYPEDVEKEYAKIFVFVSGPNSGPPLSR